MEESRCYSQRSLETKHGSPMDCRPKSHPLAWPGLHCPRPAPTPSGAGYSREKGGAHGGREDGGDPPASGGQRMTDGDAVLARSYEAGRTTHSGAAEGLLKSP